MYGDENLQNFIDDFVTFLHFLLFSIEYKLILKRFLQDYEDNSLGSKKCEILVEFLRNFFGDAMRGFVHNLKCKNFQSR